MSWRPCGDPNDHQSQIDALPELRGNPSTISVTKLCRLWGLKRRVVEQAIRMGELDAVFENGVIVVTLESARGRFGPPPSNRKGKP